MADRDATAYLGELPALRLGPRIRSEKEAALYSAIRTFSAVAALAIALTACEAPRGGGPSSTTMPTGRSITASPPRSLLGRVLIAAPQGDRFKLEQALTDALARWNENPNDPDLLIWVGRRLGYLWRIQEAIDLYSEGIQHFPNYAPLYRHRGHRYITLRQFHAAIRDLRRAAELTRDTPDEIEPDGMPNARNVPLTTLKFNIWYHLALAQYLNGDFEAALTSWRETMHHVRGLDDNIVAVSDWMYLTLMRLGRKQEAAAVLEAISPTMEIIENTAYHRRLLMYKGELSPDELLTPTGDEVALATLGYGVGMHAELNGDSRQAGEIFERVVTGKSWPAFGFIAAEVELSRRR